MRLIKYDLQDIVIAPENQSKQTTYQMVENGVMFSSNSRYHLRSYRGGVSSNVVGQWYSGEFITHIKAGTLSRLSDEDYAQVPYVLFLTTIGAIRVIVSLPSEVYKYLDKCIGLRDYQVMHFIDGDFLESFLTLTAEEQMKIATTMKIDDKIMKEILDYLALFH
ncbi:unnamed protein product [Arabis nemorensis]|uniref:Cleavage/polyadenylation specificity factor A subunit C-terminal domain-containing protein n=1 Tax=Arabis nemorensis TaxID=586526 RepID=A0A565C236_9BRAS|nr:unnamed protein product [Arabis nemorensis]